MFIVWEPILPTDWQEPTSRALARVSDPRAAQFWDSSHLVADALRKQLADNEPNCCVKDGHIWDAIALYAKRTEFNTAPIFVAGPVVEAEPRMDSILQDALRAP